MSNVNVEDNFQGLWDKHQEAVRAYVEKRDLYEALCSEVAFLLKKRMKEAKVEYAFVVMRVKRLDSFLGKIDRKSYKKPIEQTTDLAGVRVVYLYQRDLPKIQKLIKKNFRVSDTVDKTISDVDRFGYGAIHYVVSLRKDASGSRYDDLKNVLCEIQVRTVLQDAWAIIDHHLRYKQESEIPNPLKRKIHSLSALLENADGQFNEIFKERNKYIRQLSSAGANLLDAELNRDSLIAYLKKKFPAQGLEAGPRHLNVATQSFEFKKYRTVRELDKIIDQTKAARAKYNDPEFANSAVAQFVLAMLCVDEKYRRSTPYGKSARKVIDDYTEKSSKGRKGIVKASKKVSIKATSPVKKSRKLSTSAKAKSAKK